jgi:predicted nucleic acid-binding protein
MSSVRYVALAPSTDRVQLVVDANVIVQLILAGGALGPLDGHDLVAPPLLASEVTSALSEMAFRHEIPVEPARQGVAMVAGLGIRLVRIDDLYERSWELARQLGWAKSYDAEYVVLAQATSSPLVTLDGKLRRGAGHLVPMPLLTELAAAG